MHTKSTSTRPAVVGGARLRYATSDSLGTRLQEQWVRPPLHLAKAYHEKGWAVSLLTSPTAGLLEGDRIDIEATVDVGARVALISPAACRVHTMASGRAEVYQRFKVEGGAILDFWPAPLVLQRASSVTQTTELDVAPDATVLFCEVISPGRAAYGEAFEFTSWRSRLKVRVAGDLLAYENFDCRPGRGDVADWREQYSNGQYASLYCITSTDLTGLVSELHELEIEGVRIGASLLRKGGLGVKVLAADGICLRKAIVAIRAQLIDVLGYACPVGLQRGQTFFN